MLTITAINELPSVPAVYALCGGGERNRHVAYTGIAGKLKQRITQHLVRRDSSVATGTSAAVLNPDLVTEVRWWTHDRFADRAALEAAEAVAVEVLDPALRSRGTLSEAARRIHYRPAFRRQMESLFNGEPAGRLVIPTLATALEQIAELTRRIERLEAERTTKQDV